MLALMAAGCGEESEQATRNDGTGASACDTPGVSENEIRVGAAITLSGGREAVYAPTLPGMEARIAYQNEEKGGVGGRELKLEVADDASDPQKTRQAARELVDQKKVFGLIMQVNADSAAAPYLSEEGIPVVGWPIHPSYGTYENFFGYSGGNTAKPTPVTTGGEYLKTKDVSKLGVVTYAIPAGVNAAKQYVTSFETVTGGKALLLADAPPGNPDWSVQAQQLKEAGVDGLYLPMGLQDAANAYQAIVQAGVELKAVIFPAGYGPVALEQLGKKIEGASFSVDFVPYQKQLPAHQVVLDALSTYAPKAPIENDMTDQATTVGWLSADAFIRGLEEAGNCPTREHFLENLRSVTDYDGGGLLDPPVDFSSSFGRPYLTCAYFLTVQSGKFVPEEPAPLCGEVIE